MARKKSKDISISSALSGLKSSFSNLSPEAKRNIAAGVAALGGGALGAYVGGKDNRALGALLGAGAAGGLALSSKAIGNLISAGGGAISPPPKHLTSGMMWELPWVAGAAAAPIALQLQRPNAEKFRNMLDDIASNEKSPSRVKTLAERLMREYDIEAATRYPVKTFFDRLHVARGKHRFISDLIDRAAAGEIFSYAPSDMRMGGFRRFMSRKLPRRLAVYGTAATGLGLVGYRIAKRISDNRDKIDRRFS